MIDTGLEHGADMIEAMKGMSPDRTVKMVRELCSQLRSEGFHGNIWPGSITMDSEGKAVLGEPSDTPVSDRNADQVEYVAPEFFWENKGGPTADVYSLGMLLYAGCSQGVLPFQPKGGALTDKDRSLALRRRMKGEKPRLPSGISQDLRAVIRKALAYEPKNRYRSAKALLRALSATDEALPSAEAESLNPAAGAAVLGAAALADGVTEEAREVGFDADLVRQMAEQQEAAAAEGAETVSEEHYEGVRELDRLEGVETPAEEPAAEIPEAGAAPEEESFRLEEAEVQEFGEDPSVPEQPEDVWLQEEAPEQEEEVPMSMDDQENESRRYTVQKNFDSGSRRSASAAPTTRRRKKSSPVIPVLCVAAVAVIAGAVGVGIHQQRTRVTPPSEPIVIENETPTDAPSPFVILPAESPEATTTPAPQPLVEATATPAPTATPEPVPTGSPTIDGMDVEPVSDTVYVEGSGVNLRGGPGTSYAVAQTLPRGVKLQRTGTVNGWSQVQYEGKEYYISSNLITDVNPNPDAEESPAAVSLDNGAAGATASPAPTSANGTVVNGVGTTLTSGGSTTNSTGTSAGNTANSTNSANTTSTSTGTGTANGGTGSSYVLQPSGNSGSTSTSTSTSSTPQVTATRDVVTVTGNEVNLRSGPGTDKQSLITLSSGTVLQRTGTVNGWSRVVYQGREAYISDNYIKTVSSGDVTKGIGALKVTSDVNVRSGPSTDDQIYGVAKVGERLYITGLVDGKWYRVSYNGQTGYVNRNLVQVEDFAILSSRSGEMKASSNANVRSGPGTDYTVLGTVNEGSTVTVTGYADSNWYEVSYNGQVGYIAGNLLTRTN